MGEHHHHAVRLNGYPQDRLSVLDKTAYLSYTPIYATECHDVYMDIFPNTRPSTAIKRRFTTTPERPLSQRTQVKRVIYVSNPTLLRVVEGWDELPAVVQTRIAHLMAENS